MWLWLLMQVAWGRPEAMLALVVVDPSGETVFDGEVDVGSKHHFEFTDAKRIWQLDLRTSLQREGAVVDAALVERTGTSSRTRAEARVAEPEGATGAAELGWKRMPGAWKVRASWARAWSPPGQGPLPGGKSRYALAWDDATLLASPRTPELWTRRAELAGGRTDATTQASPYQVVHAWGTSYLEIEPVADPRDGHCANEDAPPPPAIPAPPGSEPVGALVNGAEAPPVQPLTPRYVAASDVVAHVTTTELTASFPDGTGYSIAAGVVLVPLEGEGRYEVRVGGLRFPITVSDPRSVGSRYLPSAHWPVVEAGWTVAPDQGVLGQMASGEVRWAGEGAPVVQGRRGVREPLVVLRHPCAEVRVKVDASRLSPPPVDGAR